MNIKTNQDTSRKYNNERISDTTEGRLLFLSGLKASRLFLLPETSSFHNSDRGRHTKRWVGDYFSCIFCVPAKKLLCIPRGLPDVISMLCLSSSSLLIFSSSSLCTVSNSSSFSLCIQTHKKQTKYWGGGSTTENLCAHLYVSDLPVLTCCLGLTLVLVLYWLQAQLSVDTWQRQKRNMQEDGKWVRTLCMSIMKVSVFKLPATLVRTCMFSSSTARGSRYSAARPASTSANLLFTWLSRSR